MESDHVTMVREAELLATSTATVRGSPRLILTLRLHPKGDFEAIDLALTARQGRRLLADLNEAILHSKLFEQTAPEDVEQRAAFEAILLDQPPTNGKGQNKL